jgi:hypothetical protein
LAVIRRTLSFEGISDPDGTGKAYHRAAALTANEKEEFREAVAKLFSWVKVRYDEMIS